MSYELVRSGPNRTLVAKTTGGKVYLWTEPKRDRASRQKVKVAIAKINPKNKSAMEAATIASCGMGEDRVEMDYAEFLCLVRYVLRNEDLRPDDPRLEFVEEMRRMKIIKGWGTKGRRFDA